MSDKYYDLYKRKVAQVIRFCEKNQKLKEENERLERLVEGYKHHNEMNLRYYQEANKRYKQLMEWQINNYKLTPAEDFAICTVCMERLDD